MRKKLFIIIASTLLLCSCQNSFNGTIVADTFNKKESYASIKIDGLDNGKVYSPEEVTITETYHSIESKRYYNTQVLPSTGDVNLLIIPVLIPGFENIKINQVTGEEALNKIRTDLNTAFFGDSSSSNLNFESVSSFYKKSSFGKLNLQGHVTNWFSITEDSSLPYTSAYEIDVEQTESVVKEAVKWAEEVEGIDMSQYDNDQDGYIDGVWLIYSAPNYTNDGPMTDYQNYWAYTSWGNQGNQGSQNPDVYNPVFNLFGWASYDFMYENEGKIDAHTYIHETGHFLGLNDYYSDSLFYNPIGKIDMMDANITDLNSYSKMLLGWSKPFLVSGDSEISINSLHHENNLIVIPDDSNTLENGKFDPFSEYILVELYTNEYLSNFDSVNKLSDRPLASSEKGVRIYHIDNRKFVLDATDVYNVKVVPYQNQTLSDSQKIILPITNNRSYDIYNSLGFDAQQNLYDEIRLIEANKTDTFSFGGWQKEVSFFKENDTFSLNEYSNFFYQKNSFDNGNSFSKSITIKEVK